MTTNKDILKLQFLTFLLILISFSGCEKKSDKHPQFEIYENHDISACGVDDPLQNIDWLREYCSEVKAKEDSVKITLYKIIDTEESIFHIVTYFSYEYAPGKWTSDGYFSDWRDCAGNLVFHIQYPGTPPPPGTVENFMKDKEIVTEIFHFFKQ